MKTIIAIKQNKDASCIMVHDKASEELKSFLKKTGFVENNEYSKINMFEIEKQLDFSMVKELKSQFNIDSDDLSIFFVSEKEHKKYFDNLNKNIA